MPLAMCQKPNGGSLAVSSMILRLRRFALWRCRCPRSAKNDLLVVRLRFWDGALTFGKRLLERVIGDPRFTGTHERAPDGFLIAYGAAVAPARQARGAVVDVAPTLLYFLGLPVARDMDGYVRTDLFHPRVQ
jgi:hypothetical protein